MKMTAMFPCAVLVKVTLHRPGAQAVGTGGKPIETTTNVGQQTMMVTKLSGGQAHRAYGDDSQAKWRGQADTDADVAVNDLLVVDTGPYAGTVLEVEDIRVPGGVIKILTLADTERVPD